MRVAECNARTAADVRLHAERAAFQAQPLLTFFNSLQKRTAQKLSPETRLFAEVCYEQKLVELVATALIACAKSEAGRGMAGVVVSNAAAGDLKATWKPLVDCCAQLLRCLKLETTNPRLSRLSDLWSRSENGALQAGRLRRAMNHVVHNSADEASGICEELRQWIELYSIPHSPMQVTTRFVDDQPLLKWNKNIVVVDNSETFAEAEAFLDREMKRKTRIYVIVGNEDDGVRFYRRIFDRFSDHGILLIWREKEYGALQSPTITIRSNDYFASRSIGRNEKISAVFLHAEHTLERSTETRFESGNLDDYISRLFVLTAITMDHFHEIADAINTLIDHPSVDSISESLLYLINSWPQEMQVLTASRVLAFWDKLYSHYGRTEFCVTQFVGHLRKLAIQLLESEMKQFRVPQNLRAYADVHCKQFVQSAIAARNAKLGRDYVVYSERSSRSVDLRIRVKQQLNNGFGLQQFLELRNGCEMTSYKVAKDSKTGAERIHSFENVLIVQRSNAYRDNKYLARLLEIPYIYTRQVARRPLHSLSSINHFSTTVSTDAKDCLFIIVCCTPELLDDTFHRFNASNAGNVYICETALGVAQESAKNPSPTLVICTTSAYFEGWAFIPRTRRNLRICICHSKMDNASLEVACDLAATTEIESITVHSDYLESINLLNAGREAGSWLRGQYEQAKSFLIDRSAIEPETLLEDYSKYRDINDLIAAKRALHRIERRLATTAKMVHARLPTKKLMSSDSPMDIASQGFVEQARSKIDDASSMRREVERLLSTHATKLGIATAKLDEHALKHIASRYIMNPTDLGAFVRTIRLNDAPETWSDLRPKVELQFNLKMDASEYWEALYRDERRPRSEMGLVALSAACVSAATAFLPHLKRVDWPDDYRQKILQCSDRHLEGCTMYEKVDELDLDRLLEMDGASFEYITPAATANDLNASVVNDAARNCSLFLYARRCYDRLTRDLFDSGLLICKDYVAAEKHKHAYDTIQLPLIAETTRRSALERMLRAESALMEYGSVEWMGWLARRLQYFDHAPEVAAFYHRTVAERDYCVHDEGLINRLRAAMDSREKVSPSNDEKLKMDAFIYSTMDTLEKFDRLVLIEPPAVSYESLSRFAHFIRSRRMPPP